MNQNTINPHSLIASLKQIVVLCKEIQTALKQDTLFFGQNDFDNLAKSNQLKSNLVDKMSILVHQLQQNENAHSPVPLFKLIENESNHFDAKTKFELQRVLTELRSVIAECNPYITTNTHVVYASLNRLKLFWDNLFALTNNKMDCVYTSSGATSK